jgi:hypothetical protein
VEIVGSTRQGAAKVCFMIIIRVLISSKKVSGVMGYESPTFDDPADAKAKAGRWPEGRR